MDGKKVKNSEGAWIVRKRSSSNSGIHAFDGGNWEINTSDNDLKRSLRLPGHHEGVGESSYGESRRISSPSATAVRRAATRQGLAELSLSCLALKGRINSRELASSPSQIEHDRRVTTNLCKGNTGSTAIRHFEASMFW